MRTFGKIFFSKIIRAVFLPTILINVISILIFFSISLLVDYQAAYAQLPFSESLEFQVATFIIIILFEITLISVIMYRFLTSATNVTLNIKDLLAKGENDEVEFKSSLRFDYVENKINKELEYVMSKTISAFLNTKGGTILIGINDQKEVLGLKPDYETLKKKNADGFLVYFTQVINTYLGKEAHRSLSLSIVTFEDKEICLVQALPAKKPTYVNHDGYQEFFIRTVSSVQPMDVRDAHNYIVNHWKQK